MFSTTVLIEDLKLVKNPSWVALTKGQYPFILISKDKLCGSLRSKRFRGATGEERRFRRFSRAKNGSHQGHTPPSYFVFDPFFAREKRRNPKSPFFARCAAETLSTQASFVRVSSPRTQHNEPASYPDPKDKRSVAELACPISNTSTIVVLSNMPPNYIKRKLLEIKKAPKHAFPYHIVLWWWLNQWILLNFITSDPDFSIMKFFFRCS